MTHQPIMASCCWCVKSIVSTVLRRFLLPVVIPKQSFHSVELNSMAIYNLSKLVVSFKLSDIFLLLFNFTFYLKSSVICLFLHSIYP